MHKGEATEGRHKTVTSDLNSENAFDKRLLSPFYIPDTVLGTYRQPEYERQMYAELEYNTPSFIHSCEHADKQKEEAAVWSKERTFLK